MFRSSSAREPASWARISDASRCDAEPLIERSLRRLSWLIPTITLGTTALLFGALWGSLWLYSQGYRSTGVVLSGLFGHSIMIVAVHDGAHRAITRSRFDRWFCSIVSGLMILPFYGEIFRRYHLLHHQYVNGPHDPLYLPAKAMFFHRNRILYMVLDVLPMVLSIVCKQVETSEEIRALPIGRRFVAAGLVSSGLMILLVRPPFLFVVGFIVSMYVWSTIRDWCEHFGTEDGRVANAYWFPLGMGIGNHEAHHRYPSASWLTMALGLRRRALDTNPFQSAWQMATNPKFHHYTKTDEREPEA